MLHILVRLFEEICACAAYTVATIEDAICECHTHGDTHGDSHDVILTVCV